MNLFTLKLDFTIHVAFNLANKINNFRILQIR